MARLTFSGEWRTTLFVVVLVPVMAGLGFWQLSRAADKEAIAGEFERKQAAAPARFEDLLGQDPEALAYRPVTLTGQFREGEYFLQDNRTVQGRYGNEVIGVFEPAGSERLVLVNRGWVEADASRQTLPEAPPVSGEVTIAGQVYVAPGKPYMLADQPLEPGWPKRVQAVEMDKIASALAVDGADLFPYPVRINGNETGALYVDWPVVNVSPAKHYGYAVQWFAMSAVLALIYLLRSTNLWQLLRGQGN